MISKQYLTAEVDPFTWLNRSSGIRFSISLYIFSPASSTSSFLRFAFISLSSLSSLINEFISLIGNVRTYSSNINGKNHVEVYVFTYFDTPPVEFDGLVNFVQLDGRICKIDELRILSNGKRYLHFILANNIATSSSKFNSYLPCVAWGSVAEGLSNYKVGDEISIIAELRSREYKKYVEDAVELHVAHELLVQSYCYHEITL